MRRALVLGGTGAVGSAVARELRTREVTCTLGYHQNAARAEALAGELGCQIARLDATDGRGLAAFIRESGPFDILVHAAATLERAPLAELTDAAFDAAFALNARSALIACREIAPAMIDRGDGDILLVGGLDRAQSLPVPVAYAATQGMLAAMAMALAKELGPHGVRINMIALGLLDTGLSLALDNRLREDFLAFSALRRFGTAAEAAVAIAWLALHNRYLNGKVIPINGGL